MTIPNLKFNLQNNLETKINNFLYELVTIYILMIRITMATLKLNVIIYCL